jgi:hypothetical protein
MGSVDQGQIEIGRDLPNRWSIGALGAGSHRQKQQRDKRA